MGDLLDRLAATDRLHDDPCLELRAVGRPLAYQWEPPTSGSAPPQRSTMGGAVREIQTTSLVSTSGRLNVGIRIVTSKSLDSDNS